MGGAVSAGEDNDELIDNLVEAEYIKSPYVERIFRAVDRGDYYLEGCKENAYRDLAWKHGNIHLSAPCIYSEVMESLKLGPGMSFLNLGSGTGYLSTMAGLVLGTYGVNHGVELHDEVVEYAISKLEEFQSTSPALDKYEFCPPSFVIGNCLLLDSSSHQYDRVYCGASCPSEHENYMKNLVRVGGILVMPLNDHLLQVTRTGETTYEVKNVLPVSFASLVPPHPSETQNCIKLPENNPLKLKEICRSAIRILLRANAEIENPTLRDKKKLVPSKRRRNRRRIRKVVIPVFDDRSESGERSAEYHEERPDQAMKDHEEQRPTKEHMPTKEQIERFYKRAHLCPEHSIGLLDCGCDRKKKKSTSKKADHNRKTTNLDNNRRASSLDDTTEKPGCSRVRSRRGSVEDPECKNVNEDDLFNMVVKTVIAQHRIPQDPVGVQNNDQATDSQSEAMDTSDVPASEIQAVDGATGVDETRPVESEGNPSSNVIVHHAGNGDSGIDNISDDSIPEESFSDPDKTERESGQTETSTSRTDCSDDNDADQRNLTRLSTYLKRSADADDEEDSYSPEFPTTHVTAKCCRKAVVFKRIAYSDVDSDDFDDFESDSGKESFPKDYEGTREKSDLSCYTYYMKQKISMLPLPQYLKMYLNFSRPV